MRLFLRSGDDSLKRPGTPRPGPDFSGEDDGTLVFTDPGVVSELGVYLVAGDDTAPPTHYSYEVSLYVASSRLVVRWLQRTITTSLHIRARPEVIEWRIIDAGGRSWAPSSAPASLDGAMLVDRITAG